MTGFNNFKPVLDERSAMNLLFQLVKTMMNHQRSLYGILDLLGDMGGLIDIIIIVLQIFFTRYNRALYLFNAFQDLYKMNITLDSFPNFLL